jgi:hypothetical protein
MIVAFSSGVGAEPMQVNGAWIVHVVVYLGAIFVAVREVVTSEKGQEGRRRAAALLACAVMGLVWLRYYQGRSLPLPLVLASLPLFLCAGFLVDRAAAAARNYRRPVTLAVAVIFGAPVLAALVAWTTQPSAHQRTLGKLLDDRPEFLQNVVVERAIAQLRGVEGSARQGLVVAPYAHLVNLRLGQASPLNVAGMCQIWFRHEVDQLAALLASGEVHTLLYDKTELCGIHGVVDDALVKRSLDADFVEVPAEDQCSLASGGSTRLFIRREGRSMRGREAGSGGNLALGGTATQSSTYGEAHAALAVDGNVNGRFDRGSISHTSLEQQPWLQVDLGSTARIAEIEVFNRTDCCSERLHDYWLLASNLPFAPGASLSDLLADPSIWKHHERAVPCARRVVGVNATARYVRVQLAGQGYLSLAELRVLGEAAKK